MDPDVERELRTTDPDIPFHASTTHLHHTWAKTYYSRPELYIRPRTIEEISKIIGLARKCHRRLVTVGCAHSPSDLTCTSSWMINLDLYDEILDLNRNTRVVVVQSGIRLHDLQQKVKEQGLMMPNLGSIDHQSIAGALSTATHGSSTRHGLLSQSVLGLKIMLADGRLVTCSRDQNLDLLRAALVSLGALGVITEVTFQMAPFFNIEWHQSLHPLQNLLARWEHGLWTEYEFTRIWWMPYMKRAIVWRANKTDKPHHPPVSNWWRGSIGFHTYHVLLYIAQWVPQILPLVEKLVVNVQYGFKDGASSTAVEDGHTGLLMDCLYSQFVNEWALPLHRGPEAISRLSAWLHGDAVGSRIPFESKGIYVHAPIEVRVSDTSATTPRPYLDNTAPDGPTLYLNATLYRPYNCDPPCRIRYYEAFEYLMKELGGRPHWAKNFATVTKEDFHNMYPTLGDWLRVRNEVDPDGLFVGDWHRRHLLPTETGGSNLPLEEKKVSTTAASAGGLNWAGVISMKGLSPQTSEESFDMMRASEAERSSLPRGLDENPAEEEEEL